MDVKLRDIFFLFFKIGLQLLGGGYVILPLLRSNVIEKRNWITEEELLNYFSLSQCIPGLIAANVSTFVGYKTRKLSGAITALAGITLPAFLSILLLASILIKHMHNPILQNAFWGIRIGVLILIFLTITEIIQTSIKSRHSLILYLSILLLMLFTDLRPEILVISAGVIGYLKYKAETKGK